MIYVGCLLFGERRIAMEIAHVQRPLDIVLETRPREAQDIDLAGISADTLRTEARTRKSVDD